MLLVVQGAKERNCFDMSYYFIYLDENQETLRQAQRPKIIFMMFPQL